MAGRRVVVVLVADGSVIGQLPALELQRPYWQETADLVAAVASKFRLDVQVLRLLAHSLPGPPGGELTLLAEVTGGVGAGAPGINEVLEPYHGRDPLIRQSLRMPYASPGGPTATLAWARAVVVDLERGDVITSIQHRTWNLSVIWEIVTTTGSVWVKQVPHRLFAHEPTVLRLLAEVIPRRSPAVLATGDEGRMLLEHLPGVDGYGRGLDEAMALADLWHRAQIATIGRVEGLITAGVPDARWPVLTAAIRLAAEPFDGLIDGLDRLLGELDDRVAVIEQAAMPPTLVHGDLHLGNARFATRPGPGESVPVVLDLGDSCVGHPAFDIIRLSGELGPEAALTLTRRWQSAWRDAVPGCRPDVALAAIGPIAALRHAAVFANFVANIEPSERPYHADDVPFWFREAVRLAAET